MEIKKILVMGAPGSGKTTAMENICDKLLQTKNLEQGSLTIKNRKIHLFSHPEKIKWKSKQYSLFKDINGVIIFIDNTIGITKADEEIIKFISQKQIPYAITANKQDLKNEELHIDFVNAPIIPTIAKDGKSIHKALEILLELISPYREFVKSHPYVEIVKIKNYSK